MEKTKYKRNKLIGILWKCEIQLFKLLRKEVFELFQAWNSSIFWCVAIHHLFSSPHNAGISSIVEELRRIFPHSSEDIRS
jgi:hypothetical protein